MMANNDKNPWLGLKTYSEGQILYGRSEEINALSQDIIYNRQTVVYGKSGIGKSSLLNAGVFPILRRAKMFPVNVRLVHNDKHTNYFAQIKSKVEDSLNHLRRDIVGTDGKKQTLKDLKGRKEPLCEAIPNENGESLWEYFHRHIFKNEQGEEIQPVIVFDQFEEIFTLCKDDVVRRNFFSQLADLINDIPPSYIYDTIDKTEDDMTKDDEIIDGTEDFVLIEDDEDDSQKGYDYLQESKFHVVITLREDFLSYLERYTTNIPLLKHNRYCLQPLSDDQAASVIADPVPGLISEDVTVEIICKITGTKPDQFQLGDGIAQLEVDSAILSLFLSELYKKKAPENETISIKLVRDTGDNIISSFYERTISNISEDSAKYLEDKLVTDDERRDSIFEDRAISHGVTKEELRYLKDERLIHEFPWNDDGMRIEFMHDILCPIIVERRKEREQKRIQEEDRKKQELEKQELIRQQQKKLEEIERENALQRRRNKYRLGIAFSLLVLATISWLAWQFFTQWEFKSSYATFTTKNGWPIGIGKKLENSDKEKLPVYYQLVRYGYLSQNTRINVLNNEKRPTRNKFFSSPLVSLYETEGTDAAAKAFANMQRQVAYWVFIPDNEGKVARQTAYSINDEELYSLLFFRSSSYGSEENNETGKKQLWANYIDKDGKSLRIRDNGADRMRVITNDTTGFYTGYQFFNESGTPQPNQDGAYGYLFELYPDGKIKERMPLDAFGDPIRDKVVKYTSHDEYGRWTTTKNGKAEYSGQQVVYIMKNRTDSLFFTEDGGLKRHSSIIGDSLLYIYKYQKGKVVMHSKYRKKGYIFELAYKEMPVSGDNPNITETLTFNADADSSMLWQKERIEKTKGHCTISYYKGADNANITEKLLILSEHGLYHQLEIDTTKENGLTKITKVFQDQEGKPITTHDINREESFYNDYHERVMHILKRDSTIVYAYLFEYENGQIVSQSVAGVDGKPVRYAGWDIDNRYYYKIKLIYNFANIQVAFKGINEFGEESLIIKDGEEYKKQIVPATIMDNEIEKNGILFKNYGISLCREILMGTPKKSSKVIYIHILDKNGSWYNANIRDGDLLISNGKQIKIARPNPEHDTYDILTFFPKQGSTGAEFYEIYFDERETKRYNDAINRK